MILSVSRRTDIPAFYSDWFFNRLKEGFVYVRNPMNIHQVSKIVLSPEVIDCIVFWSKNPKPMLQRLDELKDYMYYFQFTINAYDKFFEVGVPKKEGIINTFRELSSKIGAKRVIWRYDPILLTSQMDVDYHIHYFEEIAKRLKGYTNTCVISFVDLYKKTQNNLKDTEAREPSTEEMFELSSKMYLIANKYGITIQTCAEEIALETIGIKHGKCIDNVLIEDLIGAKLVVSKDSNQRQECGCVQSIDIGEYNTCTHGCKYCYANFRDGVVRKNRMSHDPHSPLLIGQLSEMDKVSDRKLFSFIKLPEPFKTGDIVKLKNPEEYKKSCDYHGYGINLYKILSIDGQSVRLVGVEKGVPITELMPVAIDGIEDRWVYYDPIIAASIVFPGDEVPSHSTDYSYYMNAFERCFDERKNTFKDLIIKAHLVYVHEVQHFLQKRFYKDNLKINDSKL
ncbi:MAG: DUF1848 domain-containing protein [Bacteroidales bacterium]|nr:DUF1848 domain-containing protein [Bacteroidales bacterium]